MDEKRFLERRRQRRVEVHLPISFFYLDEEFKAQTKNISILGTYLEIDRKIPVESVIKIKFQIPAYQAGVALAEINCTGIVYRLEKNESSGQYGLGIFFRQFAPGDEERIIAYVNYLLLKQEEKFLKRQLRGETH